MKHHGCVYTNVFTSRFMIWQNVRHEQQLSYTSLKFRLNEGIGEKIEE